MKEIFQLPDSLPQFYKSNESEKVLIEFNNEEFLYIIGIVEVYVLEGEIETWGFTMTVDSPITTLYSSGLHGLISISSANNKKAIIVLQKSRESSRWKAFMNEYIPDFNIFDVNGTRLTPPRPLLDLEEQLGCWFDLSKTPMSHQRLIINDQWLGICDELLGRSTNLEPIRVLIAGYKNSGKSAMMRYLINKFLKIWDKILVLDFDIGQSEFSLPTCISAFIIDTPLLGPNFTHLTQPYKSYVFESNNVMTNVPLYYEIVKKIVSDIKTNDLDKIPCFINTMGFVEGPGLDILYNLISETKPSDVIQLKFNENQDLNLHSEIINDNTKSSLCYNLWYFVSNAKNKLAKAPYLQNVKLINQHLVITSYFSKCLKNTDIYFNDVIPYKINILNFKIHIKNLDEWKLTQDEYLDIINAKVIALCISDDTDLSECVGFGVVRSINQSTQDIYVVTPVAPDLLNRVNEIQFCNFCLPSTFYTKSSQNSKYVCKKHDSIFNEHISRHFKVMS